MKTFYSVRSIVYGWIFLLFIVFCSHSVVAQTPLQFNYQAIARDSKGLPLSMREIVVRFTILNESTSGNSEYTEIRRIQTNQFGMFTASVGSPGARSSSGTLKDVNWADGKKFLKTEIDINASNNFVDLGATQLVSVPYALFALTTADATSGHFEGVAGNGLSTEDSTIVLGNSEGNDKAKLTSNRYIPLNGHQINLTDGVAELSLGKASIELKQDSAWLPDSDAAGSSFLTVNPIFPREDAVPFLFSRGAFKQHQGTVSPNEVVIWGHNIHGGGGAMKQGLPGVGYSLESNYKPTPDARWMESHEFYINPLGKQIRLKSYTINSKTDNIDFFHTLDNFYFKNPRTNVEFFRIDNFGENARQQITTGTLRIDIDNTSKQVHFKANQGGSTLYLNGEWEATYLTGMLMQKNGPTLLQNDINPGEDGAQSLGSIGNRFNNVRSMNYFGQRIGLQENWQPFQQITPTSLVDLESNQGFNQLRLRKSYTPTGSSDQNGNIGDFSWDDNFLYIKTSSGWKRTTLSSF